MFFSHFKTVFTIVASFVFTPLNVLQTSWSLTHLWGIILVDILLWTFGFQGRSWHFRLCVNVGNLRLFRYVSTMTPTLASFDNNCYRLWQRRRMTHATLTRSMRLLQLVESCVHKLGVWWLNYVLILINKRIRDSSLKRVSFKSLDLKYVLPWFYLNWTSHRQFLQ